MRRMLTLATALVLTLAFSGSALASGSDPCEICKICKDDLSVTLTSTMSGKVIAVALLECTDPACDWWDVSDQFSSLPMYAGDSELVSLSPSPSVLYSLIEFKLCDGGTCSWITRLLSNCQI